MTSSTTRNTITAKADNTLSFEQTKAQCESEIAELEDSLNSLSTSLATLDAFNAEYASLTLGLGAGTGINEARFEELRLDFNAACSKLQRLIEDAQSACDGKIRERGEELTELSRKLTANQAATN